MSGVKNVGITFSGESAEIIKRFRAYCEEEGRSVPRTLAKLAEKFMQQDRGEINEEGRSGEDAGPAHPG